uniref:Thioredoxin domain-containing protein 17 n=3 Tax=Strongyloides stercoralis TaxID=6248 RepID=A0A0K0EF16_STRER
MEEGVECIVRKDFVFLLKIHFKSMGFTNTSVDGYEELKETILSNAGKRMFVLFTGSKDKDGVSWCPDCVAAEPIIEEAIERDLTNEENTTFITCYVGDRAYWKDRENPFRKDEEFKVDCIPTLIEIGVKGKRLVEEQLQNMVLLNDFFFEE